MQPVTRITFLDEDGEKFFGEGPCRLLRGIRELGSVRAAAAAMGMAYPKAMKLLKNAEAALGFPLTTRTAGGKDGGGSCLTEAGLQWLEEYEAFRDACIRSNEALFRQHFPRIGCVVLASGWGRRFGGNKLLADFGGEPMICRALEVTRGLFDRQVVVTRYEAVAQICRSRQIPVVVHDRPHRRDTIRLGLEALKDMDACLFCPGDQPLLQQETVASMIRAWRSDRESIWRAAWDGSPGSPVLFPRWAFPALLELPEGAGGGWVMAQYPERVRCIQAGHAWELMDADSPEDLETLKQIQRTGEK